MTDKTYLLEHLTETQPELVRELRAKGELDEYLERVAKDARETRRILHGSNPTVDYSMHVDEIVRAQVSELPAEHPHNPYADEIRAMRRAGLID